MPFWRGMSNLAVSMRIQCPCPSCGEVVVLWREPGDGPGLQGDCAGCDATWNLRAGVLEPAPVGSLVLDLTPARPRPEVLDLTVAGGSSIAT
jgi:hypothetical protein